METSTPSTPPMVPPDGVSRLTTRSSARWRRRTGRSSRRRRTAGFPPSIPFPASAGGIDHQLYALGPRTGKRRWSQPLEGGNWFWTKPLVKDGTAYVADLDGNVYGVDLKDGRRLWSFQASDSVRAAPLLAGGTLVVVDRSGNAYGLKPEDGSRQWGPTLLGKTVLSDPFLLQATSASPSPAASESPAPSPGATGGAGAAEVLIVAQGGDICRLDPVDGSPTGAALCAQVPL